MSDERAGPGAAFQAFVALIARLRAPGGCPWDREQTHHSLKPMTIEEAYEVVEAIERGDDAHLAGELGDLLLQVVFHAQIASEEGRFDIAQVVERVSAKMVRRHPHVFGSSLAANSGGLGGAEHPPAQRASEGFTPERAKHAVAEEVGDLLFAAINVARLLGEDPESCLKAANRKFRARFRHVEERLHERGRTPAESNLEEMEALWQEAKARERSGR